VRVAGLDGTRGGWVGVILDDGEFVGDALLTPIRSDFSRLGAVDVIAIDIPIGFGPREADRAARAFMKGAASVVFSTPPRHVLDVPFGPGLGVSAQAYALGRRIIAVTELAENDERIWEVHPEVSFRAMNHGQPLRYRKKSSGGALERMALLRDRGIDLRRLDETAAAPLHDVLDAGAAAWSATRIAAGTAVSLPDPPEVREGRRLAIWY
jgi:predicted RNase H-like nuclease